MYASTAANNDSTGIPQAYVNQAKVLIADVLLRLKTILHQIAFLLNLLMRSRLRTEYRTTWSKT
jgi:hypothetical protein